MSLTVIETGSSNTKIDTLVNGVIVKSRSINLPFKKHYMEDGKLRDADVKRLISLVRQCWEENGGKVYVCGTSIFRTISEMERHRFLEAVKNGTGLEFHIIPQEEESLLTVYGATMGVESRVCVMVGGGGSTEITIYDKKIIESAKTEIGAVDILKKFPDLAADIAVSDLGEIEGEIEKKLRLPKGKADILILAGGAHERLVRLSGMKYEENILYHAKAAPIMIPCQIAEKERNRFFYETSLDAIRAESEDPGWWETARSICAFVSLIEKRIGAKYIVPTNIAMAYGIAEQINSD